MKKHNYQFSFNLAESPQTLQQQQTLTLLAKDIFPYFKIKSTISILPFVVAVMTSTTAPRQPLQGNNCFLIIIAYLVKSTLFMRLGSEYEYRFGYKYFLLMIVILEVIHVISLLALGLMSWSSTFNGTTSLALFILSFVDINKFKTSQIIEFEQQEKVVENYDLLDLNDTIIKLKTKENIFSYQSFTNKEFYMHNVNEDNPKKVKKLFNRTNKKTKTLTPIIDQPLEPSAQESTQTKLFKLILFHFLLYANLPFHEFSIVLFTQFLLYFMVSTKIIKRVFE